MNPLTFMSNNIRNIIAVMGDAPLFSEQLMYDLSV